MSEHADLPLPDYDHLPKGSLTHRIRALDSAELRRLREYEAAHANRPAVLTAFDARMEELAQGAEPSGGDQRRQPEHAPPPRQGSPVAAATGVDPTPPPHQGVYGQAGQRQRP
ncbi:hypothetical protein [Allokutzneria albata]|uniref:DUF8129 domain-containing protein n=1 Tax=Allokutzneria albata TaxID=211114 RepID=A0A1G9U950_ALLAB|nr:hypothetical protein [Allokutzneria albata]SDM56481.1 hypothetical protein SAMN04489726_2275 [Allokutzneria albata]